LEIQAIFAQKCCQEPLLATFYDFFRGKYAHILINSHQLIFLGAAITFLPMQVLPVF
jgi:hypothetical protein